METDRTSAPPDPKSRVKAALERMEEEARREGYTLTRNLIADTAGVARSAVSSWFAGRQLPRMKQLDSLADVLSFGDDVLRLKYRQDLYAAAGINLPSPGTLERAREGGPVTFGVVRYDESAIDGFFEDIVRAFGEFCGFVVKVDYYDFAVLGAAVTAGEVDLAGALWETPDRLLTMRFIRTPVQMGMNMLTFEAARRAIPQAAGLLDALSVRPIMNEGQASYRFAQRVLGIAKHRIMPCDYEPAAFASRLIEAFGDWSREGGPVPIVITDELMCLKVHNRLLSEMITSSPDLLADAGLPQLMIPLPNGLAWGKNGAMVAAHPRYNLALCVKRVPNDEWHNYIEEAWRIFVLGNRDFLTRKYADLCAALGVLEQEASEMLRLAADRLPDCAAAADEAEETWRAIVSDWLFEEGQAEVPDGKTWQRITKAARPRGEQGSIDKMAPAAPEVKP